MLVVVLTVTVLSGCTRNQPDNSSTLCRPRMTGDGVGRATFTVTGATVPIIGDPKALATAAADRSRVEVRNGADRLLIATRELATA